MRRLGRECSLTFGELIAEGIELEQRRRRHAFAARVRRKEPVPHCQHYPPRNRHLTEHRQMPTGACNGNFGIFVAAVLIIFLLPLAAKKTKQDRRARLANVDMRPQRRGHRERRALYQQRCTPGVDSSHALLRRCARHN